MAYIIVLNPLILGFVPDSTGAFLGGGTGDGSNLPVIAAGTALVAGVLTILDGRRRQLPAGARDRPRPQRVRRQRHRHPVDLGGRDGPHRPRGHHHPGARADRLPQGGLPRGAAAAEGRDLGRHRALHRPHRLRRRGLRDPHPRRLPDDGAGPARQRRHAVRLAGPRLRDRRRARRRPVGTPGARRDPDLDRRHDRAGVRRPGGPRPRRGGPGRTGELGAQRARAQRRRRRPRLRHPRRLLPLRGLLVRGLPGRAAPRLHAAARRLLRHDGHDDRHRRRGRAQRRGGHPAPLAADPDRRLGRRDGRRRRRRLVQHVLHRVGLRRRRGRAHRASRRS